MNKKILLCITLFLVSNFTTIFCAEPASVQALRVAADVKYQAGDDSDIFRPDPMLEILGLVERTRTVLKGATPEGNTQGNIDESRNLIIGWNAMAAMLAVDETAFVEGSKSELERGLSKCVPPLPWYAPVHLCFIKGEASDITRSAATTAFTKLVKSAPQVETDEASKTYLTNVLERVNRGLVTSHCEPLTSYEELMKMVRQGYYPLNQLLGPARYAAIHADHAARDEEFTHVKTLQKIFMGACTDMKVDVPACLSFSQGLQFVQMPAEGAAEISAASEQASEIVRACSDKSPTVLNRLRFYLGSVVTAVMPASAMPEEVEKMDTAVVAK